MENYEQFESQKSNQRHQINNQMNGEFRFKRNKKMQNNTPGYTHQSFRKEQSPNMNIIQTRNTSESIRLSLRGSMGNKTNISKGEFI